MNSDPNTKMLWRYLKAVVLGKIPYTPDTPAVLEVIKMVRFTLFMRLKIYAYVIFFCALLIYEGFANL